MSLCVGIPHIILLSFLYDYVQGEPLCMIYEVFSPKLDEFLGNSRLSIANPTREDMEKLNADKLAKKKKNHLGKLVDESGRPSLVKTYSSNSSLDFGPPPRDLVPVEEAIRIEKLSLTDTTTEFKV